MNNSNIDEEIGPWLSHLATSGRSSRTVEAYGHAIRLAAAYWARQQGPSSVQAVTPKDCDDWHRHLQARRLAPITRDFYLRPLVYLFSWMTRQGLVFQNPVQHWELPRVPRRFHAVISEQTMKHLLESVDRDTPLDLRDRAILETAYASGLRNAELVGLDVASVDCNQAIVTVTGKGCKTRTVPLTRMAVMTIQRYIAKARPNLLAPESVSPALWLCIRTGKRVPSSELRRIFAHRSSPMGLDLTPHDFRRAFATHMLRRGASPFDLKELLGHAGFRQLRHYLRYAMVDLQNTHRRSRLGR